jgi:hypothetical protein
VSIPQVTSEYGQTRWNDTIRENRRSRRKSYPRATLSTINPHWPVRPRTRASAMSDRRLTTLFLKFVWFIRWELNFVSGFFGPCLNSGTLRPAVSLTYTDVCVLSPSSKRWWWRQYAPLKRRSTSTRLHGAVSQKAVCHLQCYLQFANVRRSEEVCLLRGNGTPLRVFETVCSGRNICT